MKKTWVTILFFTLCIFPILVTALLEPARASPTPALDVKVDHVVEIRNGGLLIINDTVKLSTKTGEDVSLQNYMLGFPYVFQSNLDYAFAYEASNPNSRLKLELNVGMGRIGFYGVNATFPQTVNISNDKPCNFTVVFVFSNSIYPVEGQEGMYNATFPAYPSLTQAASEANLTIIFPTFLNYNESSFENEGINFTRTSTGSNQYFNNVTGNLSEFSDQIGWFATTKASSALEILEVNEANRGIEFSGLEQITVTDSYKIVRKDGSLAQINVRLPKGAYADVSAYDEFGLISADNLKLEQGGAQTNLTITFTVAYDQGKEVPFSVHYQLPWKNYTRIEDVNEFHVNLTLFENSDWTIRKLTTTVILPEGATLLSSPQSASLNSIQNDAFRSSFSMVLQNATPFQDLSFDFKYGLAVFWESFRPTLWMGAFVMVVGAIVGIWRVYQPPTAPLPTGMIPVRFDDLRSFVDSYDERRRYQRELESLEAQARKGKIPRRTYKVRRMSIESRLASLSRDLGVLRGKIRTAGARYADLMRQLEVAESELEGVEADISRTEVRYRRGEISAAAYHKLLEDSYRRRDRATTTIDGALLRLKEEIS